MAPTVEQEKVSVLDIESSVSSIKLLTGLSSYYIVPGVPRLEICTLDNCLFSVVRVVDLLSMLAVLSHKLFTLPGYASSDPASDKGLCFD